MMKLIQCIVLMLVVLSCGTKNRDDNTPQKAVTDMEKKNIGSLVALYPKPMTVIGAEVEGRVNWLVVGHTGIIGHNRILVSMNKQHYTNQGIKQSKKLILTEKS